MTRHETAHASWDALDEPWRAAIEVAWQAYRYGGIAVGAVLTDGNLAASRSKLVDHLAAFTFAWLTCHLAGSRADPAVVGVQVDVAAADDGGHVAAGEAVTVFQDGRDAEGR
jgi:hypothetical protein